MKCENDTTENPNDEKPDKNLSEEIKWWESKWFIEWEERAKKSKN